MKFLHKLIKASEEERAEHFHPIINTDEVFLESDMFTIGLPKLQDLNRKKRKSEEEKMCIETIKNPPSSPFNEEFANPHKLLTESQFKLPTQQSSVYSTQQGAF